MREQQRQQELENNKRVTEQKKIERENMKLMREK